MILLREEDIRSIIEAGEFLNRKGWVPATSGNISVLIDSNLIAITASGKHKGKLTERDIVIVNREGYKIYGEGKPSAEVLLHILIYKLFPETKAIIHAHSPNATVISKIKKEHLRIKGYEILKAFEDISTHEEEIMIPVFENEQDMENLSKKIGEILSALKKEKLYGFLLEAHGIYTWSDSIEKALNYIEAFEFLFECELKLSRLI